jgi:hypothetical protein
MKKPHLFWLLIDSARNIETDEDERGLPKSVSNFAKEAVFLKNVVTSAPSTIQSISSLMTSSSSYLLSRSYNNYRGISENFDYFPHQLIETGYQVHGAIYFKHGREVMSDVFGLIQKKFFPKDLSHRKEVWTNEDIFHLFENILHKNDWSIPTFCYLHFNVRVDDNISTIVQNTLDKIKAKGMMDNSIILINSDHGYPLPSRGWNPQKAKAEGWGHDQQLYNDNILTPCVIKYPGCRPGEIEDYISTLDIVPTLTKLMGVPVSQKYHGIDILNTEIDLSERLHRTDNRYIGQVPAYTSFIQGSKKCIIYKDKSGTDHFEYFDLEKDSLEQSPQSLNTNFEKLKRAIDRDYETLNSFHYNLLFNKWKKLKTNQAVKTAKHVGVVLQSSNAFKAIVKSVLADILDNKNIVFLDSNKKMAVIPDLVFAINESEIPWDFGKLKKLVKSFKSKRVIYLDNNGKIYGKFTKIQLYIDFVRKRSNLFKVDKLFMFDLLNRMIFKKLLNPIK